MWDFYDNFYRATAASAAHSEFCTRVFGIDLCQHGFADVAQLDALVAAAQLGPGQHVLDLGCGSGLIAEYLSDHSGAHVTGLDYVPDAIRQACERTRAKADRLDFVVGDINALVLPPAAFDVIVSIDTIYFSDDYSTTIAALAQALRPGGRLAFLYSHGREPWVPVEEFDVCHAAGCQHAAGQGAIRERVRLYFRRLHRRRPAPGHAPSGSAGRPARPV